MTPDPHHENYSFDEPTRPPTLSGPPVAELPQPPARPNNQESSTWATPPPTQEQQAVAYQSPYQAPHPGPIYYPQPPKQVRENGKITWAYICGAVSVLFFPIILGPIAIWLATSADSAGDPRGANARIFAVCAMIVGFGLGFLAVSNSLG